MLQGLGLGLGLNISVLIMSLILVAVEWKDFTFVSGSTVSRSRGQR